jgi:hypothetical protein
MLSKPKTNSMKRTFGYAAAKVWNERNENYWNDFYIIVSAWGWSDFNKLCISF